MRAWLKLQIYDLMRKSLYKISAWTYSSRWGLIKQEELEKDPTMR
jgi:hypothetical protein